MTWLDWHFGTLAVENQLYREYNRKLTREVERLESDNAIYRGAMERWDKKLELIETRATKLVKAHQQSNASTKKLMRLFGDYEGLQNRLLRAECGIQTRDQAIQALRQVGYIPSPNGPVRTDEEE